MNRRHWVFKKLKRSYPAGPGTHLPGLVTIRVLTLFGLADSRGTVYSLAGQDPHVGNTPT